MTDTSYTNWSSMTDKALAAYIGTFVKQKRLEQNKTQDSLATEAGISRSTLSLLERGETVTVTTLIQVLRVLDQLQVMSSFTVQKTISPLMLAKMEQKKRKRAKPGNRSSTKPISTENDFKKSNW